MVITSVASSPSDTSRTAPLTAIIFAPSVRTWFFFKRAEVATIILPVWKLPTVFGSISANCFRPSHYRSLNERQTPDIQCLHQRMVGLKCLILVNATALSIAPKSVVDLCSLYDIDRAVETLVKTEPTFHRSSVRSRQAASTTTADERTSVNFLGGVAMTMTTTTLTEDVSNNCQSSGPVGVSDGVMIPRKNIGNLVVEMSAKSTKMTSSSEVSHTGREPWNRVSWSYPVERKRKLPLCKIPRIPVKWTDSLRFQPA